MIDDAAPPVAGRRPAIGTVLLLVAYLFLAPPVFLLAPLALLLLFARPGTLRELMWTGVAVAGGIMIVRDLTAVSLPSRLITAGGIIMSGTFLLCAIGLPRTTTLVRASIAVAVGLVGAVLWSADLGFTLADLDTAVATDLKVVMDRLFAGGSADQVTLAATQSDLVVQIFPGLIALQAFAGLALAWRWHHRVAATPLGKPPRPVGEFRFNDHLIWGAIFTLALALVPAGPEIARFAACGLVVWAGIYGVRGIAVVAVAGRRWPFPARLLLAALSLLVPPFALGGLVSIGAADTWVDFRRRMARTSGGSHADGSDSP